MVVTSTLPKLSVSCTAPIRNPGASGAKVTCTMQDDALPAQVVLARVKSKLGAPWVTTWTGLAPKVVPGRQKVHRILVSQGRRFWRQCRIDSAISGRLTGQHQEMSAPRPAKALYRKGQRSR